MYKFKEQYRDAKISVPSIRLVITSENVNEHAELIHTAFPAHKEMIELVEEEKKEVKKISKSEKELPVSSPPTKIED